MTRAERESALIAEWFNEWFDDDLAWSEAVVEYERRVRAKRGLG